ncbi:hypothetical protein [Streptomyces sp. sk2.1]|uniref:hypothetical protein n=1 Tax=Streptomyces sp. sk2.1 TaxID=2478959 RepID=UPI0011E77B4E|nr:hypothetical protein [Streptomyces sp. sk2.1]
MNSDMGDDRIDFQRNTAERGDLYASQYGDVNHSESRSNSFNLSGGYLVAAVVAGVLLLLGGGFYAYQKFVVDKESDIASIGTDPGETGVRDTWKSFQAAATKKDYERACSLYSTKTRLLMQSTERCINTMKQIYDNPASASQNVWDPNWETKVTISGANAEIRRQTETAIGAVYLVRDGQYWRVSGDTLCHEVYGDRESETKCKNITW